MPTRKLSLEKIAKIIKFREAGLTQKDIAYRLSISQCTICQYLKEHKKEMLECPK